MKSFPLFLAASLFSVSAAVAQQSPSTTTSRPSTSSTATAVERDLRIFADWVSEKVSKTADEIARETPRVTEEFNRQSKRIDKAVDSLTVEGKREYSIQKKRYGDWSARRDSLDRAARQPQTAQQAQDRLLGEKVVLNQARATELPDLYARFIETTRAQRRQWSSADWSNASAVLGRLNARYEQVREQLPLEERVRIRSWQGEFRTLEKARDVKGVMAE
ncbi:hypothetical protein [Hymenobacter psychrotolerans]|uniref:DUF3826 domain-containing protein n=1 Tax=Hymenobacter psychrotolerans DSM 18569 TaxID=1121959 RepID=A0A1M7AX27_9BACT|nr:hypothetical protein [Hymenobacter psychrotolerans]SHL47282.1 hypothetical protein SAMN02746009_02793 [Hymenobacter psychrotolerans DSM 18569]